MLCEIIILSTPSGSTSTMAEQVPKRLKAEELAELEADEDEEDVKEEEEEEEEEEADTSSSYDEEVELEKVGDMEEYTDFLADCHELVVRHSNKEQAELFLVDAAESDAARRFFYFHLYPYLN